MAQWRRLAMPTWVAVLLTTVTLQAQDSPFPEPSLLAGKSSGAIVMKRGRLYKNSADFGLVQVPENRGTQHTRLLQLPFIRHHARKDSQSEPLFILGGGPGKSNLWRERNAGGVLCTQRSGERRISGCRRRSEAQVSRDRECDDTGEPPLSRRSHGIPHHAAPFV